MILCWRRDDIGEQQRQTTKAKRKKVEANNIGE